MQRLELEIFFVRIVTTHKGGATSDSEDIRFATRESAIATADKLQAEFDEDCEPRRAYVFDWHRIAIAAGGEPAANRRRSQHMQTWTNQLREKIA
jgi:hypothetical protein